MKLTNMTNQHPLLWQFMLRNPPRGLLATKLNDGYGTAYAIKLKQDCTAARLPIMNWFQDRIATVHDKRIELYVPAYLSDIEDIVRKFEAQHPGQEVEIVYWNEAPSGASR